MKQEVEVLKIKIEVLRSGNQPIEVSLLQAKSILSAVDRGVSWEDLDISKTEFQRICRLRGIQIESGRPKDEIIKEFLSLWQMHCNGDNVKEELRAKFQMIKDLVNKGEIKAKDLHPFSLLNFLNLQEEFKQPLNC